MGLIGTDSSLSTFNQQAVKLGQVPKDKEFYGDIERALANQVGWTLTITNSNYPFYRCVGD